MTLFFIILIKIFPLYINVILGFLSSKLLHVQRESIAALLIYILGPIVVFSAVITVKIDFSVAILPTFLYVFCSTLGLYSLFIWGKSWDNPTGNIVAFSAGTGNTGYFGINCPLVLLRKRP
jgi:predicted permease